MTNKINKLKKRAFQIRCAGQKHEGCNGSSIMAHTGDYYNCYEVGVNLQALLAGYRQFCNRSALYGHPTIDRVWQIKNHVNYARY